MVPNPRIQNPAQYNYRPMQQPVQEQETCIWSILALIFAFLLPLAGVIFGIIALVKIAKNPNLKGKGMAIAGLIIGGMLTLIVPALIAIGSLAYFGVLSPEKFLPQRCYMEAGIACIDFNVKTDGAINIVLQNSLGYQIESATLNVGVDCTPKSTIIENGKSTIFTCKGKKGKNGDKYESEMILSYIISETGISHQNTGSLTAQYS